VVFARFQSARRAGATRLTDWFFPGLVSMTVTRRSAAGNGSALSSTVSTTENTVVVVPIPSASVRTAINVKAWRRASERQATRSEDIRISPPP